ncbi:MAG: hypothetical protein EA357_00640 [Micavibrio sp.]|nr:MAG: hypothetical protein EA357_00640 [Micavibrio sp.]
MDKEIKLSPLEREVIQKLLEGDDEAKEILREQFRVATVLDRTVTDTGFYVDFSIPEDIQRLADREKLIIQGIGAKIPSLAFDASFILFVKDGAINLLEGFAYEEPWPNRIDTFELFHEVYNRKPKGLE